MAKACDSICTEQGCQSSDKAKEARGDREKYSDDEQVYGAKNVCVCTYKSPPPVLWRGQRAGCSVGVAGERVFDTCNREREREKGRLRDAERNRKDQAG